MPVNLDSWPGGHLLALPSEVRLLIYGMIFPACRVHLYTSGRVDEEDHIIRCPAILATCRTLYNEARPVLYENTEFYLGLTCDPVGYDDSLSEDDEDAVLDDLYQQARPHIDRMRKVSFNITLLDGECWEDTEDKDRWFEELASELALLSEAPQLRKVHLTLEAKNCHKTREDFDRVIGVISRYMCSVTVTVEISPSLRSTDFQPSHYRGMLAELKWVDNTHEVYSNKLADLMNERSQIVRKIQGRSMWAAAKSAEYRDLVNNEDFFDEGSALREQARLMSGKVESGFHDILGWENGLMHLKKEITTTEDYLRWVTESNSTYCQVV